jgi:predicted RNase H-like HicB family nuclease
MCPNCLLLGGKTSNEGVFISTINCDNLKSDVGRNSKAYSAAWSVSRKVEQSKVFICSLLWSLNNMMKQFDVIIEKDSEGYFVASVPALKGCHTQAKSLDVLMERIREAIELCLEVQGEIPESLDFIGVQRVTVAA